MRRRFTRTRSVFHFVGISFIHDILFWIQQYKSYKRSCGQCYIKYPLYLSHFKDSYYLFVPLANADVFIKYFSINSYTITSSSRCHLYNLKYYLGPVYTEHQSQRCDNSRMTLVIMFSLNPFLSDSIAFNENIVYESIASVITGFLQCCR